jgi:hypothetical protein
MLNATELAWMQAQVISSLDVSVVVKRKSYSSDGAGGQSQTLTTLGTYKMNVVKPTGSQIQQYAALLGVKVDLMVRYDQTSIALQRNDYVVYNSVNYEVHAILNAESYTFSNEAVLAVVL